MPLPKDLHAEPEPPGRAWRQVLYKDVGLLDEPTQYLLSAFLLKVQRQRLFRAVKPDEVAGETFDRSVVATGKVPYLRALDLYHSGAKVGELPRGERRGDRLLQGDDRDAF